MVRIVNDRYFEEVGKAACKRQPFYNLPAAGGQGQVTGVSMDGNN